MTNGTAQAFTLTMPEPDIALLTLDLPDKGANILCQAVLAELTEQLDQLQSRTDLAGLIIETPTFPGWKSLRAMVHHFRFVRGHHRHIKKVALVTDSALGNVAEHLASHFVAAEIRHFPAGQLEAATQWIASGDCVLQH